MATSTDICESVDQDTEFLCHVCMTDNTLRYAKVNTTQGRGVLYGKDVPSCAKQTGNKAHLRAFSHECFPSGLGDLRKTFFPGHTTMPCSDLVPQKSNKVLFGIIWTSIFVVVTAFIASLFVRSRGANVKAPKVKVHMPAPSPASSLPSPVPRVIQIPYSSYNRV
jgi:hypothetical protein